MAQGPEAALVKRIRDTIAHRWPDALVWKTHGSAFSTAGMPDLFVLLKGHLIGLEVKAPRPGESDASVLSRVTPLQLERLKQLRRAGATAEACWDVDQAVEIVSRYVPESSSREDWSRDARLYALQDHENKLRKELEHCQGELQALRVAHEALLKQQAKLVT